MNTSISAPISLNLLQNKLLSTLQIPVLSSVSAGFPSPASDFMDVSIDLNKEYIKHPSATFFARVTGNSMIKAGISEGDLLIVDRSIKPTDNRIVVCFLDGEFTLKRLLLRENHCILMPENDEYEPIIVEKENYFQVWGVVVHVVKSFV